MVDADQLKALKDIHMPLPVSSWPPSVFLMCLVGAILTGLILLSVFLVRFYRRKRFQRQIFRQLSENEQAFISGACTATIASHISSLLKQVACVYFPPENITGLYGEDWFLFLKKTAIKDDLDFLLIYFTQIPYQKDKQFDLNPLFAFAREWIGHQIKIHGGEPCLK